MMTTARTRRRVALAVAPLLALTIGSCGSPGASNKNKTASQIYSTFAKEPYNQAMARLQKCAKHEGTVVMYATVNSDTYSAWTKAFEKKYPGIKVKIARLGGSSGSTQRLLAEERAGKNQVDVVEEGGGRLNLIRQELGAHTFAQGDFFVPPGYPRAAYGSWWVSVGGTPNVITWNTDLVSSREAPKSYQDLLDPKWRGKISIDVDPQNFVIALLSAWGKSRAETYLKRLVQDQHVHLVDGHSAQTQLLAAGAFDVSVELYGYRVASLKHEGAPLNWAAPKPLPTNSEPQAIMDNAQHPCAAALLSNFTISKQGATIYAASGRTPHNPGVKGLYPRLKAVLDGPNAISMTPPNSSVKISAEAETLMKEILTP